MSFSVEVRVIVSFGMMKPCESPNGPGYGGSIVTLKPRHSQILEHLFAEQRKLF